MQIQGFSCTRPQPEHMDAMRACATAAELDALVAADAYTTDVSRALYLVARRHGDAVTTGVVCCCSADELGGKIACEQVEEGAATARADELEALGAHARPITIAYEGNMALDLILGAARSATPLYNLSNGADQLVVWRMSRPEAIEAVTATFATIEGHVVAGQLEAAAAQEVARRARKARSELDPRAAALHPLALLVSEAELAAGTADLLPGEGLLVHRFA